MRTLYLDCGMGAAGDMLTAALAELLPEPDRFAEQMNALGIPGVRFSMESVMKSGIRGTKVTVKIHGETEDEKPAHTHPPVHAHEHTHHHHSGMEEIRRIIDGLPIPETIRNEICAVYEKIAEAESRVHGVPVMQIHFHEVGTMDAIADITAVCLLMDQLKPEQVIVSPVHVGSGHIVCAHGVLPVPAPATAYLLKDIPIYGGKIEGELCTPTGAALLRHFATRFGDMPVMRTQAIGYGMGKREFETVNCLRAMLGDAEAVPDPVCELSCNVDDMTGEEIGFAVDRIRESGALDVCAIPLMMKKSRPGTMIQVL